LTLIARENEMDDGTWAGREMPEGAIFLRLALERLGINQSDFARFLQRNGDGRGFKTILRGLNKVACGRTEISGEMRVLLNGMKLISWNGEDASPIPPEVRLQVLREALAATNNPAFLGRLSPDNRPVAGIRTTRNIIKELIESEEAPLKRET
jgi:hypothetical protein